MLTFFRNVPIRRKLTLLMLIASGSGVLLTGILLSGYAWFTARDSVERDLAVVSSILAYNVAVALEFRDPVATNEVLSAMRAKQELEGACLYLAEAHAAPKLFVEYSPVGARCPAEPGPPGVSIEDLGMISVQPVVQGNERVGWLRMRESLVPIQRSLAVQALIMLGIVLVSIGISVAAAFAMQRVFAGPILKLAATAREVSETQNYALRVQAYGRDEVGGLVRDFNTMLDRIARADAETRRSNRELEVAMQSLKEAQAQLVQAEKMASLGALVAGVAHEINTPVGVGVTAASTLQSHAATLRQQLDSDTLRRSDLARFVALADESTQIVLKNLQRAADLIQSFKQVAVDQSSGERRRFALRNYLDEILLSLRPQLKKTGHTVEVDCPEDVLLDSYPGAIAQIFTNFITNSLIHGFDGRTGGHIRIAIRTDASGVTLRYSDDGKGVAPEHVGRIFDPFFTTKRGTGGSGLGLHIVYNLVTQLLGGTIQVVSQPGRGAEFVIHLPFEAQRAAA